ncbi:MAG: phosphotransferase [Clostridia bacterium]
MKLENVIAKRSKKTIYRDGDSVIKVFNENYSKADILNEALNLARVEETGLATPGVKEVSMVDGKWAIVTTYQEGKTIAEMIEENPEKIDEYLDIFVSVQLQIHDQKAPLLTKLKDKMVRKISLSDLDATTKYELHQRLEGMPKHTKLCHGDFSPANVVIKEDSTAFILDWAHATQGNASADVARSYLLFCLKGHKDYAEKYLDIFCKKSDTAKQYVLKWLPIVAASQLVKGKEEEKAFLLSWTDVVEYE